MQLSTIQFHNVGSCKKHLSIFMFYQIKARREENLKIDFNVQDPVCTEDQFDCAQKIETNFECPPPCSGLILSSFIQNVQNINLEDILDPRQISGYYRIYTKRDPLPLELKGFGCHSF